MIHVFVQLQANEVMDPGFVLLQSLLRNVSFLYAGDLSGDFGRRKRAADRLEDDTK